MRGSMVRESGEERREFIRLPYLLPVEFYLVSPDNKKPLSNLIQGFTKDLSRGGLCLEVNNLKESWAVAGLSEKAYLLLYINLPFSRRPVEVYGRLAWFKKLEPYPHKFLLGISYLNRNLPETARPVKFAKSVRFFTRLAAASIILLFCGLAGVASSNVVLRKTNRLLVNKLVQTSEERSRVSQKIFYLSDLKEILKGELREVQIEISNLNKEKGEKFLDEAVFREKRRAAYEKLGDLQRKINNLEEGELLLQKKLSEIKEEKIGLEEKTVKKMYNWLKMRQNKRTGLVLSYEGDPFLEDWAFTYDQALAAQCFSLFHDFKSAQKIFDFYRGRAKKINGAFANAYDATTGHIVESIAHTGPNIWLGLAVLQYIDETGDKEYLPFVEEIANWVMTIQEEDSEGGLRGGMKVNWFSTEHNLDAYAFFNNLYKITKDERYLQASGRLLAWVKKNVYIKAERRLKRGRGDATIATDTFAWAIATLGPGSLKKEKMNPDDILKFAEEHCQVTVSYSSDLGPESKITGFDFAKARNLGRGGVVSSELTAQMIVAYEIMSDFYRQENNLRKAKLYKDKANFFLAELDKLIISSASKTGQEAICLPYATHQNVDTGHGWRTPKGSRTGCIAGTVYAIFAKKNFNPFEIN